MGRKEQQVCARVADRLSGGLAFVARQIVGDDNVTGARLGARHWPTQGSKCVAVDRPVQHEGRDDAVMTQVSQQFQCLPVTVRNLGGQSFAFCGSAAGPGHTGLDRGFIYEDQMLGIKPVRCARQRARNCAISGCICPAAIKVFF